MGILHSLFGTWSALAAFNRLPSADRTLVFYAESKADWPHLGPLVEELTAAGRKLCYVTSQADDPVLSLGNPNVLAFHVGSGSARTAFFKAVDAKVVVMTLPDLETYHLKRSVHAVHYVYVFHSMVSTHMIYRKGAFDAYDTVFCVGPHHVTEIRRNEEIHELRPKALVEHGYARLDRIVKTAAARPAFVPTKGAAKKVLFAPSWGVCSFIEAPVGDELIRAVIGAGHSAIIRLHPMTVRHHPKLPAQLAAKHPALQVITDMNEQESLQQSDLMISDWSGAALDYAYGLERPVLFIDTPKKINNPEFPKIALPPLEEAVREEIGAILPMSAIASVAEKIAELVADPESHRVRIRASRDRWIYNVGSSAAVGASHIARIAGGVEAG
jgi:hypothetical protein